jgi:pilus assembly protein CpaB
MSSAVRVSIILVLLFATAALGILAINLNAPRATVAAAPTTAAYFVAARPLSKGTLAREQDFALRSSAPDQVPPGAIVDTPDAKASLPGSLVRNFLDVGTPITMQDILRPSDRGFLASVLAPDTRAISIKVDEESGVSGLIRPGDFVDVVLTQVFDKDEAKRATSETVLGNIRVIAIDQEIAQGARQENAQANAQGKKTTAPARPAGKFSQTVSLELAPEQVKRITVARQLGTLSLVIRASVDQWNRKDAAVSGCDVSAEVARQNAVAGQRASIAIHTAGDVKQYFVKKEHFDADVLCDDSSAAARPVADAGSSGRTTVKRR